MREINLEKYLPEFIKEYKEIAKILEVENPEFQILVTESNKILKNLFINDCDENGIAKFEKLMNIYPDENDTLDTRKTRMLSRWYEALPYSFKFLINKLNNLCGINNYDININYNLYKIYTKTRLEFFGQVEELLYLLKNILPANLISEVENEILYNSKRSLNVNTAISFCEIVTIS